VVLISLFLGQKVTTSLVLYAKREDNKSDWVSACRELKVEVAKTKATGRMP